LKQACGIETLLHAKVFVINNNNKKDERIKVCTSKILWSTTKKKKRKNEWKVCTLKFLSSKTKRMKEWKFAHQNFCRSQQQQQKG
jgi:hypothetical protein